MLSSIKLKCKRAQHYNGVKNKNGEAKKNRRIKDDCDEEEEEGLGIG